MDTDRKRIFARLTALLYVIAALHITALYFSGIGACGGMTFLVHVLGGVWIGGIALFLISNGFREILKIALFFWGALTRHCRNRTSVVGGV